MRIIFLDQNKWIDLARVSAGRVTSGGLYDVYHHLRNRARSSDWVFPLSVANIIETAKRHDLGSRSDVVKVQAEFSNGLVFRSRKSRLFTEIKNALSMAFGHEPEALPKDWMIASNFIRAFEEDDQSVVTMTALIDRYIGAKETYIDYMLHQDDQTRRQAIKKYLEESSVLISRIENRRANFANYDKETRQRAYAAQLFLDHQGLIIKELNKLKHTLKEMEEIGPNVFMKFIEDIPTLNVELKLSIGREAQTGPLKANDLGDVENFYTSIPYADIIVAEKNFVNLATQTKLDKTYGVELHTNLEDLVSLQ